MISNNSIKRTFKVILNSAATNSYSGTNKFNLTYYVDLTHIIFDNEAFNKSYYMSFNMQSTSFTSGGASTNVTPIGNYCVHIDFGKGLNVFQYNQVKNTSGILGFGYDVTSTPPKIYFDTKNSDNAPVFVQNIRDISQININILDLSVGGSGATPTNDGTIDNIFFLTFTEA